MRNQNLILNFVLFVASFTVSCAPPATTAELAEINSLEIKSLAIIDHEVTKVIADQMSLKCDVLYSLKSQDNKECKKAAEAMSYALDFNYIKRSDGASAFVFMHRRLRELLADPSTFEFLAAVQTASEDALYLNKSFNLWDLSLQHCDERAEIAIERIAVLFQDGASTAAQIKYLLTAQHPLALQLSQTVNTLEEALRLGKAKAYPAEISSQRTAHYHYYVPRYLAQKIRDSGVWPKMAMKIPFLFNSSYELHQIQKSENPDMPLHHKPVLITEPMSITQKKFIEKWNTYDALYSDLLGHLSAPLKPFKNQNHSENMQDLYLGYRGALAGAGITTDNSKLIFSDFIEKFSSDPKAFSR